MSSSNIKKDSAINVKEQRLSDMFENFSAKKSQRLLPRERPTELLAINEQSPILHLFTERIRKFEQTYLKKSGFILSLLSAGFFAFMCIATETYMPKLPIIEVLFVVFLVAFLFNYYLIRDGEILPYIETESENFVAKVAGFSGLASLLLFIYAFQKCELQTALFSFGSSWIVYALIELCSKSGAKLSRQEIIYGLLMVAATGLILQPNFTPELKSNEPTPNEDADTPLTYEEDYTHLYGVIASFISGILFGYMNVCIRQLKNYNYVTITHVFTLTQVPFIPAFFPLQGLVSPQLGQWIFMIGLGLCFSFILQLFIRSAQLENTTKSLLTIPQFIAFITLFSMMIGIQTFGQMDGIKVFVAIIILVLSYKFIQEIENEVQPQVVPASTDNMNSNKDIPLQTFNQQEQPNQSSLNQKLLDDAN